MTKEFNNLEEIEKYYDEETNTYVFKENNQFIGLVVFNFDLNINADIKAFDIKAHNISAWDITAYNINARDIDANDINVNDINAADIAAYDISANDIKARNIYAADINVRDISAWDINANDIKADNISYYAVCFAHNNIKCKSIKGSRKNAKHFVLNGILEAKE